jgi:D-galactarolactone isomerase
MIDPADNLTAPGPANAMPPGAIDTHMHIFEAGYSTDLASPPPPAVASLAEYRQLQRRLGLDRAVVVQPNAYRFDNSCLEATLAAMGDTARGVAVVPPDVPEAEIDRLGGLGVRAARIMDFGNGAVGTRHLHAVADRVAPFGWHTIVQFNGRDILEKLDLLKTAPGRYIIDHAGKFIEPVGTDSSEFMALLSLIDRGNCYVKLSACYETSLAGPPRYEDVGSLSRALAAHAPERLMWASNWPHVSATPETYPDDGMIVDLFFDWVPETARRQILVETPAELYDFPGP